MPGTIADLRGWAERTLPGEEGRARGSVKYLRRSRTIEPGPHGVNARQMDFADLVAGLLCVLNPGPSYKSGEAVEALWALRLVELRVWAPSEGKAIWQRPQFAANAEAIRIATAPWDLNPEGLQGAK